MPCEVGVNSIALTIHKHTHVSKGATCHRRQLRHPEVCRHVRFINIVKNRLDQFSSVWSRSSRQPKCTASTWSIVLWDPEGKGNEKGKGKGNGQGGKGKQEWQGQRFTHQ